MGKLSKIGVFLFAALVLAALALVGIFYLNAVAVSANAVTKCEQYDGSDPPTPPYCKPRPYTNHEPDVREGAADGSHDTRRNTSRGAIRLTL